MTLNRSIWLMQRLWFQNPKLWFQNPKLLFQNPKTILFAPYLEASGRGVESSKPFKNNDFSSFLKADQVSEPKTMVSEPKAMVSEPSPIVSEPKLFFLHPFWSVLNFETKHGFQFQNCNPILFAPKCVLSFRTHIYSFCTQICCAIKSIVMPEF